MKMKSPDAREITLSKSDRSGQGDWRHWVKATLLNRYSAKVRRSSVVSLFAVGSYRKCDNWVGLSKKCPLWLLEPVDRLGVKPSQRLGHSLQDLVGT